MNTDNIPTPIPVALCPTARYYWKAPFRYDEEGQTIWDANNQRVLDVRGWGYLTGKGSGALGLDEASAIKIQDDFGEGVVKALNTAWMSKGD